MSDEIKEVEKEITLTVKIKTLGAKLCGPSCNYLNERKDLDDPECNLFLEGLFSNSNIGCLRCEECLTVPQKIL